MKRLCLLATLFAVIAAHDASAQVFLSPFVDTTISSPSGAGSSTNPGVGIAFGNIARIVGFESEVGYHPQLLDDRANVLAKNRVVTFSGNTLIGPTIGHVKLYGAIGAGDLFLNVTSPSSLLIPNPASISTNYFTLNAGGGVMGFFTAHLGVRGDLRYFRAYGFKVTDLQTAGLTLDHFDFWRASVGIAVKF